MKIKNYYVDGAGYNSPPQDGKGNEIWDQIEIVITKEEYYELVKILSNK